MIILCVVRYHPEGLCVSNLDHYLIAGRLYHNMRCYVSLFKIFFMIPLHMLFSF